MKNVGKFGGVDKIKGEVPEPEETIFCEFYIF